MISGIFGNSYPPLSFRGGGRGEGFDEPGEMNGPKDDHGPQSRPTLGGHTDPDSDPDSDFDFDFDFDPDFDFVRIS